MGKIDVCLLCSCAIDHRVLFKAQFEPDLGRNSGKGDLIYCHELENFNNDEPLSRSKQLNMSTNIKTMLTKQLTSSLLGVLSCLVITSASAKATVELSHGVDESAGGGLAYIITTKAATYYLEKTGGGLSSIVDKQGVDWLGFHNREGSGWKGEYRGFPNSVHRQDGDFFHAMKAGTDRSTSVIETVSSDHVRIVFTSGNGLWEGVYDFYPDRCDFTMSKVSGGYKYWVLYEGVPGGEMDDTDYWYASIDDKKHLIGESFNGDFPGPEWIAFGDVKSPRMLYVLNHEDDDALDEYVNRPYMTVLGFGRSGKDKFLEKPKTFSIGFVESTERNVVKNVINKVLGRNSY
jgi:hypothetical protein